MADRTRLYSIQQWREGYWQLIKSAKMTKSAAIGLLNQFSTDHRCRLINDKGSIVLHRGVNREQ